VHVQRARGKCRSGASCIQPRGRRTKRARSVRQSLWLPYPAYAGKAEHEAQGDKTTRFTFDIADPEQAARLEADLRDRPEIVTRHKKPQLDGRVQDNAGARFDLSAITVGVPGTPGGRNMPKTR
jgi:hypothetical protein